VAKRPAGGKRHDGQVEDRYDAVDIVVKRSEGLTVTFADEHVVKIDLMQLRLACPCATCRSLRERGEAAWPRHGSPTRLQITRSAPSRARESAQARPSPLLPPPIIATLPFSPRSIIASYQEPQHATNRACSRQPVSDYRLGRNLLTPVDA